jgi:hypothetical protein
MPLDPRLLNSVVRISSADALLGTGSLISVPSEGIEGAFWPYVVTAHHVVANQVLVEIGVPDPLGHGLFKPVAVDDWRQPIPDVDLAIAPFPLELVPRFLSAGLPQFVPEGMVAPLGSEIFYLGIFAPREVPMARAATLGALRVPIESGGYRYVADLVDCRSYGGFSGSPCLSVMQYANPDARVELTSEGGPPLRADGTPIPLMSLGSMASFAGIFTAHYSDEASAGGVVSRYGVGVMLPCDYVREGLMTDEAKSERREWDKTRQARKRAALPPLEEAAADAPSEFERFEDLTRKLVQTPKAELDEQRKES